MVRRWIWTMVRRWFNMVRRWRSEGGQVRRWTGPKGKVSGPKVNMVPRWTGPKVDMVRKRTWSEGGHTWSEGGHGPKVVVRRWVYPTFNFKFTLKLSLKVKQSYQCNMSHVLKFELRLSIYFFIYLYLLIRNTLWYLLSKYKEAIAIYLTSRYLDK